MIAWKGGRESSRAVNDALPLLARAGQVSVVTITAAADYGSGDEESCQKICAYLARHGVNAVQEQIISTPSFPIGDLLLNHACEAKMDLVIMGAYAQSRRGAFMLSPVARHMMSHMTVPIFFSH
jgi:nucleotide-binding universal stress UspA family protein